jgi:calcineurin-like phosphoesterase family protein
VDFFTADLHLDHPNILWYSPGRFQFLSPDEAAQRAEWGPSREAITFKPSRASIERMNDALINGINERVGKKDRLWILGDFAVRASPERTEELRERIKCKDVRMVWGNHDDREACRPLFSACYEAVMVHVPSAGVGGDSLTEDEVQAAIAKGKLGTREAKRMQRVYLSHYAHVVWQASHKGVYHLYGHSHGNLEPWRERTIPSALSLDVGVDVHGYKPVSWEEIDRVLSAKRAKVPPHTVDHHVGDEP